MYFTRIVGWMRTNIQVKTPFIVMRWIFSHNQNLPLFLFMCPTQFKINPSNHQTCHPLKLCLFHSCSGCIRRSARHCPNTCRRWLAPFVEEIVHHLCANHRNRYVHPQYYPTHRSRGDDILLTDTSCGTRRWKPRRSWSILINTDCWLRARTTAEILGRRTRLSRVLRSSEI